MFTLRLSEEFKKRAQAAIPFPRGVVAAAGPSAARFNTGAFMSLGAIALGGLLMVANVAHERQAPVADAQAEPAATIQAVALDPPKPSPSAVAAKPAPEKTVARIDTSPIAAIPDPAKIKPKHKHHPKKLDNQP